MYPKDGSLSTNVKSTEHPGKDVKNTDNTLAQAEKLMQVHYAVQKY